MEVIALIDTVDELIGDFKAKAIDSDTCEYALGVFCSAFKRLGYVFTYANDLLSYTLICEK